jgi:hypothetical protein
VIGHLPRRLPFSLDPLVAEAKRRARRRRLLLAVTVLAFGCAGGGTVLATHPFGWLQSSAAARYYQQGSLVYPVSVIDGADAPPVTVSASSRGAAFVVGRGVAWRWDGHAWQNVPLPRVSGANLESVAAIGPHDAWAVGYRESDQRVHNSPLIAHWDGARWSLDGLAGLTGAMLSSVSAAGPRDVWAAGVISTAKSDRQFWHKEQPLLLHWDGVAWRRQSLPWATPGGEIDKVVATGPSSVWVVPEAGQRQPPLEHWNGSGWRAVPSAFGPKDVVAGFSALSGSSAWAVGSYRSGERALPLAAHWNGSSWRVTSVPNPTGDDNALLRDVAAVRSNDAWAIGQVQQTGPYEAFAPKVFMLHWDGRSWTSAPGSAQSSFFSGTTIAASMNGRPWAITNCGGDNIVLGWNGSRWKAVAHPRDERWTFHSPAAKGPPKSCAPVSGG